MQMQAIEATLVNGFTSEELREWLVTNVKGLGWKEASHFLRNIGHRNLAILDRHILRNLEKYSVIRSLPKRLTKKEYLRIEEKFRRFAIAVGLSMDELDLLFWSMETGKVLK
jgi:N-glycosylase/DNA lyase